MTVNPSPSPDPIADLGALLTYPFMVNALEAASIVAVLAGITGWYMALRRQAFAGHTLSVMAFPGAAGAALVGLPAGFGYYLSCSAAALAIATTGRPRARAAETASVGTVQAVGLAAGLLFLSLNSSVLSDYQSLLFGTFLGISSGQVVALLAVAAAAIAALSVIGRPLLFATIDREVANARGVPVAALDFAFLLILALAVAAVSQITGALLVFALLVAPAATAQLITMRPLVGLMLSVGFGLLIVWLGLGIAYFSIYPVGFYVTTVAVVLYALVRIVRRR
jgi:zinc/manganese transport system permease protein